MAHVICSTFCYPLELLQQLALAESRCWRCAASSQTQDFYRSTGKPSNAALWHQRTGRDNVMGVPLRESRLGFSSTLGRCKHLELLAVFLLVSTALLVMPGGLTPHRRHLHKEVVDEVLDVVTTASPDIVPDAATLPIDIIHRKGMAHRGSWMFVVDDQLRFLLVWRSPRMVTCPSSWSMAGEHVVAGETFEAAAVRGLEEEVEFLGEADVQALGVPYLFRHKYQTRLGLRTDLQWTRSFLAWSKDFSVDFAQISSGSPAAVLDPEASSMANFSAAEAASASTAENTRMVGLPIAKVVGLALRSRNYFCNKELRIWMLRSLAVSARVLQSRKPRAFKEHVQESWDKLEDDGAPICCRESESGKAFGDIDVRQCGVVCSEPKAMRLSNATERHILSQNSRQGRESTSGMKT